MLEKFSRMNKTLKCFYDFSVSPASYDFFTFLISAELCRVSRGFDSIDQIIKIEKLYAKDYDLLKLNKNK